MGVGTGRGTETARTPKHVRGAPDKNLLKASLACAVGSGAIRRYHHTGSAALRFSPPHILIVCAVKHDAVLQSIATCVMLSQWIFSVRVAPYYDSGEMHGATWRRRHEDIIASHVFRMSFNMV